MNTAELTTALAQKLQLPKTEVTRRLEDSISVITAELLQGNSITFPNFGMLEIKKREERISVNPMSGKRMLVPPKLIVKFKTAGAVKEKLKEIKES